MEVVKNVDVIVIVIGVYGVVNVCYLDIMKDGVFILNVGYVV